MKLIILYRYHNNLDFCLDRLNFIKKLNPDIPIFGLYGGVEKDFSVFSEALKHLLENNYCIKGKSSKWKWQHSDLAYRLWYTDFGHSIEFDSVVVLEWDLLIFQPLETVYKNVGINEVGLTGLVELEQVEKKWFWTGNPKQRKKWLRLLDYVKKNHDYKQHPFASLCPGVILPKCFLELYSRIDVPELCHDELRIPLFAQIFGCKLIDLGFYKKWYSKREWKYFNCNDLDIEVKLINKELSKIDGRRVFHPFREKINNEWGEIL